MTLKDELLAVANLIFVAIIGFIANYFISSNETFTQNMHTYLMTSILIKLFILDKKIEYIKK